jgi:hypothetical protein
MTSFQLRDLRTCVTRVILILSAIHLVSAFHVLAATIEVVKVTEDLDLISIEGPIEYQDDVTFRLRAFDSRKAIVALKSPGGNLDAGLSIGRQIRENGFSTLVGNKLCASACALAWLGGTRRYMTSDASIGFHAAYVNQGTFKRESGMANALIGSYLTRLGLSDEAILYLTQAPPDYLNWLDFNAARQIGIEVLLLNEGDIKSSWPKSKLDETNSRRAVSNFFKRLRKVGISGLVMSVGECYSIVAQKMDVKSIEYCLSLDIAASLFDNEFAKMMKFPKTEFFEEPLVQQRFVTAAKLVSWSGTTPVEFFHETKTLVRKLLSDPSLQ